ncbi:MAG: hypothetical protein IPG66_05725 [Hydrogenophilales bacterium]|nr:hypothetical protein [Hydrogenophilales bacterium]
MKEVIDKLLDAAFEVQRFVEVYNSYGELVNTALGDILEERHRQIHEHGFDAVYDDRYNPGVIAAGAASYALNASYVLNPKIGKPLDGAPSFWALGAAWWKPKTPREDLVRAAALILAEIERIDRDEARHA